MVSASLNQTRHTTTVGNVKLKIFYIEMSQLVLFEGLKSGVQGMCAPFLKQVANVKNKHNKVTKHQKNFKKKTMMKNL